MLGLLCVEGGSSAHDRQRMVHRWIAVPMYGIVWAALLKLGLSLIIRLQIAPIIHLCTYKLWRFCSMHGINELNASVMTAVNISPPSNLVF